MADAQNPRIDEQLDELNTELIAIDNTIKGIITDLGGESEAE